MTTKINFKYLKHDISVNMLKDQLEFKILDIDMKEYYTGTLKNCDFNKDYNLHFYLKTLDEVMECMLEIYYKKNDESIIKLNRELLTVSSIFKKKEVILFEVILKIETDNNKQNAALYEKIKELEEKIEYLSCTTYGRSKYINLDTISGFEVKCEMISPINNAVVLERPFINTYINKINNYSGNICYECSFNPNFKYCNNVGVRLHWKFYNASEVPHPQIMDITTQEEKYNFVHEKSTAIIKEVKDAAKFSGEIIVEYIITYDYANNNIKIYCANLEEYLKTYMCLYGTQVVKLWNYSSNISPYSDSNIISTNIKIKCIPHKVKYDGKNFVNEVQNAGKFNMTINNVINTNELIKVEFF